MKWIWGGMWPIRVQIIWTWTLIGCHWVQSQTSPRGPHGGSVFHLRTSTWTHTRTHTHAHTHTHTHTHTRTRTRTHTHTHTFIVTHRVVNWTQVHLCVPVGEFDPVSILRPHFNFLFPFQTASEPWLNGHMMSQIQWESWEEIFGVLKANLNFTLCGHSCLLSQSATSTFRVPLYHVETHSFNITNQ